jgi:inorganic triphosphatase YgiF
MQRHLTALEANLVEATGAGLLALVAAARGLAPAGANAAADAMTLALGASGGLEGVQTQDVISCE